MASATSLVVATTEQSHKSFLNHHSSWGKPLSLASYVTRERELRQSPYSIENLATYVLAPSDNTTTIDFFCSCEAYKKPCIVKFGDGRVVEGYVLAIASVHTPEQYRGKGYASRMITLLMDKMTERAIADERLLGSTLYSDVGTFYTRFGWEVCESVSAIVQVENVDSITGNARMESQLEDVRLITMDDLDPILEHDHTQTRQTIESSAIPAFTTLLTKGEIHWHQTRSMLYANLLNLSHLTPHLETCGAIHISTKDFILWTVDVTANCLTILRVRGSDATTSVLLKAADAYVRQSGLTKMIIWDPPTLCRQMTGVEILNRKDSLSSLCVFKASGIKFKWVHNEKFAWV